MRIDVDEQGEVTIIRPEDRLDIVGYLELEEIMSRQFERGRTRLVLDLEEATFINSGALAVISRFWADCARARGVLVIARPGREARNALHLGDVDSLVDIYRTLDEAMKIAATRGKPEST